MGPRGKQKPSDASNEFSNALNREKPVAKGTKDATPPQPRGSKVAPVQTRRCEELCSGLGLTMSDIRKMKRKYDDNDMYHSGEITQTELFFMIREDRRPLTVGILRLGDVLEDQKFLSFDQYLLCVVTFAVFTKPELYQFVFDLYDDDQSGALDEREFTKMSLELQSKQFQFSANVTMAVKMLGNKEGRAAFAPDDGLMDLGEFMKFAKNFPVAFYPIMNMQKNVRASTLGESRWSRITANKLKVQQLVSYMRQHRGGIPPLSVRESIANVFSGEISSIRKRAASSSKC
uniref:EF-hand domain-containing protein n=1 Tax=Phytophthora ramorum TaxID=164328 RepID=H3HD25_PHYRM